MLGTCYYRSSLLYRERYIVVFSFFWQMYLLYVASDYSVCYMPRMWMSLCVVLGGSDPLGLWSTGCLCIWSTGSLIHWVSDPLALWSTGSLILCVSDPLGVCVSDPLCLLVQVWQIPWPCPRLCLPTRPVTSSACPSVRWDPGPMPISTNGNTRSAYLMKSPCVLCKPSPRLKQPRHISGQCLAIVISIMSSLQSHPITMNMISSTYT